VTQKQWRVAILGLGHWYSAYNLARGLTEYPNAQLVAAAWHNPTELETFTRTFSIKGYSDYAALLEQERVEIIHIATPVAEICDLAILCARAGKHLIVGKPMAMTLEQADRMVDAVEAAGVCCFPFQGIMRLGLADLKTRLDAGEIGELAIIHQACRWSIAEDWHHSGTPGWFADPNRVPGGAFIDEGIYWIDAFRWLTSSEILDVEARTANIVHKSLSVEDWGQATFTMRNGAIATLEASWTINAPRPTGPSPKQNSVVRLELVGTRGEIHDQWFRAPGRAVLAAGARDWVFERQTEEPFVPGAPQPLAHVIECVERGRQPAATIRDARTSLAAALAAYQSARERRRVSLSG
jgi:scyllo-inositol 2-dehydrogenase (NAD+)